MMEARGVSDVLATTHRDHANLAKLLDAAERQLALYEQGETPDYDIILGVIDYCLNYPDLYHHPKEDLILRRLRQRDPEAARAVGDLEDEHRALGALTRRFAGAVNNILGDAEMPRDALQTIAREFLTSYRAHMHMEEQVFLPAARRALDPSDWAEIDAQLTHREDPLFGTEREDRYRSLRKEILSWAQEND